MTRRTERVAEAIRRVASEIFQSELKDPRMSGFITITKVEVTPDLRLAKIYYSVLGDTKKKSNVKAGLASAKSFIKMRIADEIKLRYAPDILMKIDESAEHTKRISDILDSIHREEKNERD
jgi:ribosome-binding factor A